MNMTQMDTALLELLKTSIEESKATRLLIREQQVENQEIAKTLVKVEKDIALLVDYNNKNNLETVRSQIQENKHDITVLSKENLVLTQEIKDLKKEQKSQRDYINKAIGIGTGIGLALTGLSFLYQHLIK